MGDNTPKHPGYEEMKDTPWITQARNIADIGGRGVLDNYNKVNTFDEATRQSLEARNNEIYKRAFDDMSQAYNQSMNKYAGANYNRLGTLNSTPSAYITDQYMKDYQRQMNDLAYNKAINYDTLMDKELQRRYNTLNMFGNMYQYGQTPYQQDVANWNTRNTNRDIAYQNALAGSSSDLFGINKMGGGYSGDNSQAVNALLAGVSAFKQPTFGTTLNSLWGGNTI